jgi:xanthine dehydrogenase molybdopterin-binding subunit B
MHLLSRHRRAAQDAAKAVTVVYESIGPAITDIDGAIAASSFFDAELGIVNGDVDKALAEEGVIVSGSCCAWSLVDLCPLL